MSPTEDAGKDRPDFPSGLEAAGAVWITFGSIGLTITPIAAFTLLVSGGLANPVPFLVLSVLGGISAALVAAGFRTLDGMERDMRRAGIGSIVLGLLVLAPLAWTAVDRVGRPRAASDVGLAMAGCPGTIGTLLVTAGFFALAGRARYRAWRDARHQAIEPRRGRTDESDSPADIHDHPAAP